MASTFTQIYIQIVFSVKFREALITTDIKDELMKFITGIIQKKDHKLLAINAVSDHIHIFIDMNPDIKLMDLVREIKANSSRFINQKFPKRHKFQWQEGYGAFSYAFSQKKVVINYIQNQEEHHKKRSFREEFLEFLKRYEVEYDDKYVFDLKE
jgi:REP element-mobilizing transposase RayT